MKGIHSQKIHINSGMWNKTEKVNTCVWILFECKDLTRISCKSSITGIQLASSSSHYVITGGCWPFDEAVGGCGAYQPYCPIYATLGSVTAAALIE